MSLTLILVFLAIGAIALIVHGGFRPPVLPLPEALKDAELVFNEQTFSARIKELSIEFVGRPDRVYRTKDGLHHPLDIKTGAPNVYFGHKQEVSLQAFLLRKNGYPTGNLGFLSFPNAGKTESFRLFGDDKCLAWIREKLELPFRGDAPEKIQNANKCAKCGQQERCASNR